LLRSLWREQKYTDKYLQNTFKTREEKDKKMRTRRYRKNDAEGLEKVQRTK
jgi:hypothetical protein